MTTHAKRRSLGEQGAAAVELALVLPLLMFIVCATIDLGRMIAAQITITQAAREGVRVWALGNGTTTAPSGSDVTTAVQNAATGLAGTAPSASESSCITNAQTTVTVTYTFQFLTPVGALASLLPGTPVSGSDIPLTAVARMECER